MKPTTAPNILVSLYLEGFFPTMQKIIDAVSIVSRKM